MLGNNIIHILLIILFRSYADLKAEANRYYFSFLWWIIEPVLYMSVFLIVFGKFFQRAGDNYVPFLLCGLVSWKWFASTLSQGSISILNSKNITLQVSINKIIFPISILTTNAVRYLFVLFFMIVIFLIIGIQPSIMWLTIPFLVIIQFFFINACTCFAASIVPLFPDLRLVLDNALMLMFFLSGIFFDISTLSGRFSHYLFLNPIAFFIHEYRQILLSNQSPNFNGLFLIFIFSMLFTYFSYRIMVRFDQLYPKLLIG